MLAAVLVIAAQAAAAPPAVAPTAPPPEVRPTDLFECRIPADATEADLVPRGLFLAQEIIDHVDMTHRWEYLSEAHTLFGAELYGSLWKYAHIDLDSPVRAADNVQFTATVGMAMDTLAGVIEQSLLGIDCEQRRSGRYQCRYPGRRGVPSLSLAPAEDELAAAAAARGHPRVTLTCDYWPGGDRGAIPMPGGDGTGD